MASKRSRPGTDNPEKEPPEKLFLMKLADCCNLHAESSHASSKPMRALTEQDEMPERCQRDVVSLSKILPRVEETYAIDKEPHVSFLPHLCSFYESVIHGVFCPHAPLLLEWGKGGKQVLPRIVSLYQHLASKGVLKETLKNPESPSLVDKLCMTIADLMAFIPSQRLQECLVRDLIHLLFDLAVIAKVLPNESGSVQVSILEESMTECKLNNLCMLTVEDMDLLYILWSGTLTILTSLLNRQRSKRLQPSFEETAEAYGVHILPTIYADLIWSFVLNDGDLLSSVLASLRKVLSSTLTTTEPALVARSKVSAANLLNLLLEDLKTISCPTIPLLLQVALLVAQTTRVHFQDIAERQTKERLASKDNLELSCLCTKLIINAIIFPPTVKAETIAVRSAALYELLDCLPLMGSVAKEAPFVKDDISLAHVVLRAIHTVLYSPSENSVFPLISPATNHCSLQGSFPSLFELLNNAYLGNVSSRIISAMLLTSSNKSIGIASTCNLAKAIYETQIASVDTNADAASENISPKSGSKRRGRPSQQVSPFGPQGLSLQIERSPKRSKIGDSQPTLATPSPASWSQSSGLASNTGIFQVSSNRNVSCHESFSKMLVEALLNAKKINNMVDPCRILFEAPAAASIRTLDSKGGIIKTIASVSNALHLLLSLMPTDGELDATTSFSEIIGLLMKALKAVALSLSSHCKGSTTELSDEIYRCINYVIRVGLEDQLRSSQDSAHSDAFRDGFRDAIADCSRELFAMHSRPVAATAATEESDDMQLDKDESSENQAGYCNNCCFQLKKRFNRGMNANGSQDWLPCLCKLLAVPSILGHQTSTSTSHERDFQRDCAILLFERLPVDTKCALLSSLRPTKTREDIDESVANHPMGHLFSYSPKAGICSTKTMLTLSPLFALSAVLQLETEERNGCDGSSSNHTGRDLVMYLSSCLGMVSYGKFLDLISKGMDRSLTATAYLAVDRIHEVSDLAMRIAVNNPDSSPDAYGSILRELLLNPLSLLSFVLGHRFAPRLTAANDDESQRPRRDSLYDTLEETYRTRRVALLSTCATVADESLSSEARIEKWKCLASTCLRSSVGEMAQIRSRQNSSISRYNEAKAGASPDFNGEELIDEGNATKNPLVWLLRSAFGDESSSLRFLAARDVGLVLLGNKASLLYALFSTPSNWRRHVNGAEVSLHGCEDSAALDHVVTPLFLEVDRLLCRYCHVPQSQLSFTMGPSITSDKVSTVAGEDSTKVLSFQRSAVMALSSLCEHADVDSTCGLLVFEHAFARLIRLWTAVDTEKKDVPPVPLDCASVSSVTFAEMTRLNEIRSLRGVLLKHSSDRFVPRLFSDILLPSTGLISASGHAETPGVLERENRERQFRLLLTFIGSLLLPTPEIPACEVKTATANGSYCMHCVSDFVEEVLPFVLSAFIMVKDHDSLLLATGFNLFVVGENRKVARAMKKAGGAGSILKNKLLGSSPRALTSKTPGIDTSTKELAEQTKLQCLAPGTIEHILPRVLMANDRSQLLFFLEVVIQKKCSLQQMISSRDVMILKTIVLEFGKNGDLSGANHALRTAAKAKMNSTTAETPRSSGTEHQGEDDAAVCEWVTSSFMYLMVNVVQYHWKSRTVLERTRALRSLKWIIKFLSPAEAPQYLPQIMATVNMAMEGECTYGGTWQLRLLAVQALSDFVRTAIQNQYETVGCNLATIVVSLFPILCVDAGSVVSSNEASLYQEAAKVAIDLLEWLTQAKNGQSLASYFQDIPFLPPTKSLDKVREALRSHGVNFGNLYVTQNTQYAVSVRDSLTSDGGGSVDGDDKGDLVPAYSSSSQAALRRRLHVVGKLFSHENVSVRRVVLQHLIDLLRANRGLFNRLVESEEGSSLNRFVTISAGSDAANGTVTSLLDNLLQRCHMEVDFDARLLLATCLGEVGAIAPNRLGETRADFNRAESSGNDSSLWRLKQAPWQSRPVRYELKVVTNHLVVALKAAPSSADQNKIAFAIQQLLELLDEHAKMSSRSDSKFSASIKSSTKSSQTKMSDWLREQLSDAGVIETIEPFWGSQFKESEAFATKEPPFFHGALSYFTWLSYWLRWMLKRSHDDARNQWCSFFYACRTAVRSKAGMPLAEFIVPLLVLDRLCNGNSNDEKAVINEFLAVFDFSEIEGLPGNETGKMSLPERQKAVNGAFMILDTLQHWAEKETEERYQSTRSSSVARSAQRKKEETASSDSNWLWEESISAIDRLLKAVPLSLQAKAAAAVGMHARALRLMEMAARAELVPSIYDTRVDKPEVSEQRRTDRSPGGQKVLSSHVIGTIDTYLLKQVLGQLNDCETMEGIANTSDAAPSALDDIMVKESKGEWSGALYDYERALELNESWSSRSSLEQGSLRCLLELGQLETVLYQVNGIVNRQPSGGSVERDLIESAPPNAIQAMPYAVEAAWRLGRWSTLTQILYDIDQKDTSRRRLNSDGIYRVALGSAMHGLHERSETQVASSIRKARHALMSDLSNVARDSYSRSYSYLVRLHCLREVENACEIMCAQETLNNAMRLGEIAASSGHEGWSWDGRLAMVAGSGSTDVVDVRLALSRLAGDAQLEGGLYLTVGKQARKNGLVNIAANFLSQAEACCSRQRLGLDDASGPLSHVDDLFSSIRLQSAKLKYQNGESTAALRILGLGNVSGMLESDDKSLQTIALAHERNAIPGCATNGRDQANDINRFSRRLLQSTRWMVEGGMKGGSEVIERFRIVQKLSPKWEKGYFQLAKYIDTVLESRVSALAHRQGKSRQLTSADDDAIRQAVILSDENCMKYLLMAMDQYVYALKLSSKHVYQALPRLLSLWFDFTSYKPVEEKDTATSRGRNIGEVFVHRRTEANDLLSMNMRTIPAHCFYTAMPQLISRVGHENKETAQVVCGILTRVLTKHPEQAMWSLAWLLNSADKERNAIGEDIFKRAQASLLKRNEKKWQLLLAASRSLFRHLIGIAKYQPKDGSNSRSFSVKAWRGDADLADFIPPVQEALSVSPTSADIGGTADAFPQMVPRMRTFCSKVTIMQSKAKPKKATVFMIPSARQPVASTENGNNKTLQPGDIGEMHFLVKQEARGDLRKDARVQNLNNVINRLLAASNSSGSGGKFRQQRRLHLRTFAVTCLSEDCGILEWVPNTDSMRNLVMASYNPQASPFSVKRRGRRLGNYGDGMTLKSSFEKCQSLFFKNGNLHQAAAMFEEVCLKPHPPLLYWYFVQHFMDPHSWYEARTRFTLSCAAWSAVGHVIGLGDRHSENILVDTSSGQCVHVDFDCIFDKGLNLPKPEVVPFRLSPNMLDAFGPIGADGVYTGGLKSAMTTLRDNRDTLLSVLEPFTKDPIIDWKRQKSTQRGSGNLPPHEQRSLQAKKSITTIDERLKGIYNLRNPNFKRVNRTDGWSQDTDDEMMHMLPLSVEGQVHKMITEATSHGNLVQLYVGWMPWV